MTMALGGSSFFKISVKKGVSLNSENSIVNHREKKKRSLSKSQFSLSLLLSWPLTTALTFLSLSTSAVAARPFTPKD